MSKSCVKEGIFEFFHPFYLKFPLILSHYFKAQNCYVFFSDTYVYRIFHHYKQLFFGSIKYNSHYIMPLISDMVVYLNRISVPKGSTKYVVKLRLQKNGGKTRSP